MRIGARPDPHRRHEDVGVGAGAQPADVDAPAAPQGIAGVGGGHLPSSRASRAPPSASSFHSAATFSSPSRFLVPTAPSPSRGTPACRDDGPPARRSCRRTARCSRTVTRRSSRRPACASRRTLGAEGGGVDADEVGVDAAGRAQVGVLVDERRRRAFGEVVDERPACRQPRRVLAQDSTSALITAWNMSCSLP